MNPREETTGGGGKGAVVAERTVQAPRTAVSAGRDERLMRPHGPCWLIATLAGFLVLSGGLTECRAAAPLVGLCGQNYRAFYVGPLQRISAQGRTFLNPAGLGAR
jgi:hypothetical protein